MNNVIRSTNWSTSCIYLLLVFINTVNTLGFLGSMIVNVVLKEIRNEDLVENRNLYELF